MDRARNPGRHSRSALRRWLAARLRPPRILRPTRAGWSFFAITLGVGFAALNTGNNLLYLVLSLMLAFLVLSGVLSEASLRGIQVRRRIPKELYADTDATVVLEITNAQKRVVAFAIVVEDRVTSPTGDRPVGRCFVLRAQPGETIRRGYRLHPDRRGPLEFSRFQVVTRFPFGLFSKSLSLTSVETTLVYPRVEPVPLPANFGTPRNTGEHTSGPTGSGADAIGLREHSPGDSLRRIHWRATLRKRELLVREVESEREAEVEVRLRTRGTRPGEPFERAVCWAASEVASMLEVGTRVSLHTDDEFIAADDGARHRARLLSFLAIVEPESARTGPASAESSGRRDEAAA